MSFSAYITSTSIVDIDNRRYGLKGSIEYELSNEELESKVKISNDIGMCGLSIDLDYQINKNWSFEISFAHEQPYMGSVSEKQKSSASFSFTYRK